MPVRVKKTRQIKIIEPASDSIRSGKALTKLASDFLRNESGATSIEYAMIAAGISIVILAAVTGIGSSVKDDFVAASSALK